MRATAALLLVGLVILPLPRAAAQGTSAPPATSAPQPSPASTTAPAATGEQTPGEQQLGVPIFPAAQFIRSYDAGQGQRYYLFGSQASLEEVVAYYRTALKQKGDIVFERPATYMFEVGRYRPETMAFPPGVTVKDFTSGGTAGYPNPTPKAQPERFPTVIQIVPVAF